MKLKIEVKRIIFFVLGIWYAFSYVQIGYLHDCTSWYRPLFYLSRLMLSIVVATMFLLRKQLKNVNYNIVISFGLFSVIYVVATVANDGEFFKCLFLIVSLITTIVFFKLLSLEEMIFCIKGMVLFLWILLLCQTISIIQHPTGLYNETSQRNYFFLGHVNLTGKILILGIIFQALLEKHENKRLIKTVVYSIWCIWVITVCRSYVSIGGILLLFILIITDIRIVSSKNILIGNMIIGMLLIAVDKLQGNLNFLFTELNKISRVSSLIIRLSIWEQGMKAFEENIFGYGYITNYSGLISYGNYIPSSAHNLHIDLLISVGVLGLSAWYSYLFMTTRYSEKNKCSKVLLCGVFVYSIMWNFEPYLTPCIFVLLNTGLAIINNVKKWEN